MIRVKPIMEDYEMGAVTSFCSGSVCFISKDPYDEIVCCQAETAASDTVMLFEVS